MDVKLAMSVLEKILERAKIKASVYKSLLDGDVTVVVSVPGVKGVTGADEAAEGPEFLLMLTVHRIQTSLERFENYQQFALNLWTDW